MGKIRRSHSSGKSYRSVVLISILVLLVTIAIGVLWVRTDAGIPNVVHVVIVTDQTYILSLDRIRHKGSLLTLPSELEIPAADGMGVYPIESLWKLGRMRDVRHDIVAESIGSAFGIPNPWYIGFVQDRQPPSTPSPKTILRSVFGLAAIPKLVTGSIKTDIPLPQFVMFLWNVITFRPDDVKQIFLTLPEISFQKKAADGHMSYVLDYDMSDAVCMGLFEDEDMRREAVTVSVYNATDTSFLAERIGRVLSHMGAVVTFIGNATPAQYTCLLTGSNEALGSYTARVLTMLYACRQQVGESQRADLHFYIGQDFLQ